MRDLRLERHLLDRLRPVDALDDRSPPVEGPVDVALAHAAVVVRPVVGIHVAPLVDLRRLGVEARAHVEVRGALLVARSRSPRPRPARPPRTRPRRRRSAGPVADVVLGEQRLVGRDAEALEVAVDVLRHVAVRDDRTDALHRLRLRGVERGDRRRDACGERSALTTERLPDADVVDELRPAGDVADAVVPRQPWRRRPSRRSTLPTRRRLPRRSSRSRCSGSSARRAPSFTSSRPDGRPSARSAPCAASTKPGVQKPHWAA